MKRATLKTKLLLGFSVLVASLGASSIFNYLSIGRLAAITDQYEEAVQKNALVQQMQSSIESQRIRTHAFLLGSNNREVIEHSKQQFQGAADELPRLLHLEEAKRVFAELSTAQAEYSRQLDELLKLRQAGHAKEALALFDSSQLAARQQRVDSAIAALMKVQDKVEKDALEQRRSTTRNFEVLLILLALVGLVCGLLIAGYLSTSLSRSISAIMSLIQEIANNNLSVDDLDVATEDELGQAALALNAMKNNLRELVNLIARTAEHVASASEEISSSATQQAQSAETQKGQATQVAVAMQEMSSTVHDVSDNSNSASEASRQAAETARQGGMIVEDSLAKMQAIAASVSATAQKVAELGKSSDQIGRIIGVIDDIADQTNLLALNAAIEAARAGEQGRGFAVVADEVRKLAERTTSATKEVAQMVQGIQEGTRTAVAAMHDGTKQVEVGVETTAKAGDSLKQIIRMSEQVGEMVTHIATAATEQSSATEQVNQNVEQITRLVSEAAAGAQQSAQACQDLSGLALDLQKMVSNFKLQAGPGSGRRPSGDRGNFGAPARAFAASAS